MQNSGEESLAEQLASLPPDERAEILDSMSDEAIAALRWDYDFWARPKQQAPPGDWRFWLVTSGRGFGKNFCAVGWLRKVHRIYPRMALIARTANDAREIMLEGESGLLTLTPPHERPIYNPTKKRLTWPNGAVASVFSSDEPEALRGPQCYAFWADELCAWKYPKECWDNLMFGFRLGTDPRGLITTTPKPIPLYKQLLKKPGVHITRGSSYENISNLAPAYIEEVIKPYEGTRLGKQELHGDLVEEVAGALWHSANIHELRLDPHTDKLPAFVRVVVGVDPATGDLRSDEPGETGIIVAAKGTDGHAYIMQDSSLQGSPDQWARRAIVSMHTHKADRIVAETNQGGAMVESTLRTVDSNIPYRGVHASRGKVTRAEPIAALYEQGKVHHVGVFPVLEDQMTTWVPGMKSPDRMDALVWALTDLMLQDYTAPPMDVDIEVGHRESPWAI